MSAPAEIPARLSAARVSAGLTQRQLARRAGLQPSVLCAYERGTRMPGTDVFLRIVRATGGEVVVRTRRAEELHRADATLQDVLALAEHLPHKRRGPLAYPVLKGRAG